MPISEKCQRTQTKLRGYRYPKRREENERAGDEIKAKMSYGKTGKDGGWSDHTRLLIACACSRDLQLKSYLTVNRKPKK
jgi:hypothetical protein